MGVNISCVDTNPKQIEKINNQNQNYSSGTLNEILGLKKTCDCCPPKKSEKTPTNTGKNEINVTINKNINRDALNRQMPVNSIMIAGISHA